MFSLCPSAGCLVCMLSLLILPIIMIVIGKLAIHGCNIVFLLSYLAQGKLAEACMCFTTRDLIPEAILYTQKSVVNISLHCSRLNISYHTIELVDSICRGSADTQYITQKISQKW